MKRFALVLAAVLVFMGIALPGAYADATLQWVNARRQAAGLPLIGQPPPPTEG